MVCIVEPKSMKTVKQQVLKLKTLDAKYIKADLPNLLSNCTDTLDARKQNILNVFNKYEEEFGGTLGLQDTPILHFNIMEKAIHYNGKLCQVPKVHLDTFKKEKYKLESIEVLAKIVHGSEWSFLSQIVSKQDELASFINVFGNQMKSKYKNPTP